MSEPDHVLGLVDDLLRLAQGSAATTIEVESDGLSVKVTRLAFGLPVGAALEFADEVTLSRSLLGRREI